MKKRTSLFLLIIFLVFPVLTGCGGAKGGNNDPLKQITLKYWRVWDEADAFSAIFEKYRAMHPNVKIEYRKLRYDEYEQELLQAFATGRGPDIISIENSWVRKYQENGLIAPLPPTIRHSYPVQTGALKNKVVHEIQTRNTIPLVQIQSKFMDVVFNDVVINTRDEATGQFSQRIYGLPLYLDTLAMFYNKDLFNNAGISTPPQFWDKDFQQTVKNLTRQDSKGQIIQSGLAMGGSNNIDRSSDILSLLMMQNGTEMMNDGGQITLHLSPEVYKERRYYPGIEALRFYSDFANPAKDVYCWNETMESALDLFTQNKVGIMFGYSYSLPLIKEKAPKLNFSMAKMPQISGNPVINYANYWVESVYSRSPNIAVAWDLIQFMAAEEENAKLYLEKTKKPSALRTLRDQQLNDLEIGIFAEQALTAQSWYKGHDPKATEAILKEMIQMAVQGQADLSKIAELQVRKIQQTVKRK